MNRLSGLLLRFGRVLLGYTAAVVAASVAMAIVRVVYPAMGQHVGTASSSLSEALAGFVALLLLLFILIAIFALPGFVLAVLLNRIMRFRSWASFACLGALNGALGVALLNAIPEDDDGYRACDFFCRGRFGTPFLLWLMLAGLLAGLVFRRVAIGSRS